MYKEADKEEAFIAALNGQQAIILSKRENGDFAVTDLTKRVKTLVEQDEARFIINQTENKEKPKAEPAENRRENKEREETRSPLSKRTKITDEVGARIMTLHDCGWTNSAIAREYGLSPATIGNYIKKQGGVK